MTIELYLPTEFIHVLYSLHDRARIFIRTEAITATKYFSAGQPILIDIPSSFRVPMVTNLSRFHARYGRNMQLNGTTLKLMDVCFV